MKTKISFLSMMLLASMLVGAATYKGALELIADGISGGETPGFSVDLLENDGAYTIALPGGAVWIDQLVLDTESGDFSRDGYLIIEGAMVVTSLVSGYMKDDTLAFHLNFAPEATPEIPAYAIKFKGGLYKYPEVASDYEMYENYAEEIFLSDLPLKLVGDYNVYNTTDKYYQKCYKMYLTPDDKFDIQYTKGDFFIQSEYGEYMGTPDDSRWFVMPHGKFVANGHYVEGYYYFSFYASEPAGGYAGRFAPHIDPAGVVPMADDPATNINLRVTEITGDSYTEITGHFGDEKCSVLNFLGNYYNTLVYKCELNPGDEIVIQTSGFSLLIPPAQIMVFKSDMTSYVTGFNIFLQDEISYTVPIISSTGDVYYFLILSFEDRNYDNYSAFDITVNRATITALNKTSAKQPSISTQSLQITVSNTTEAVNIYNVSGQLMVSNIGAGSYAVPQAGVYVVKAGGTVSKVVVRP